MGYKGRIIAIVFTLMYITVCLLFDLINGAEIHPLEIAFTTSLLLPMYFFGFLSGGSSQQKIINIFNR